MASYFYLTLDTLAPSGITLKINNGATYTTTETVTLSIGCSDASTTGYQMKIWGIKDVTNESDATWQTFATSKSVTLASGDGLKTVHIKVRDDVYNESSEVTSTITLNTSVPAVTIQSQDVTKISKVSPKNVCTLTWYADSAFTEYKVCVVSSINATQATEGLTVAENDGLEVVVYGTITEAIQKAKKGKVKPNEMWLAVSNDYTLEIINDANFIPASDLGDAIKQNGLLGRINGVAVYESANVPEGTDFVLGNKVYCHFVPAWSVPVHVADIADGKHIGSCAVQARKVYGAEITKPETVLVKKSA